MDAKLLRPCGHWRQGRYITVHLRMGDSSNTVLPNRLSCKNQTIHRLSTPANTSMALRRRTVAPPPALHLLSGEMAAATKSSKCLYLPQVPSNSPSGLYRTTFVIIWTHISLVPESQYILHHGPSSDLHVARVSGQFIILLSEQTSNLQLLHSSNKMHMGSIALQQCKMRPLCG
jgi:hypothetical protein